MRFLEQFASDTLNRYNSAGPTTFNKNFGLNGVALAGRRCGRAHIESVSVRVSGQLQSSLSAAYWLPNRKLESSHSWQSLALLLFLWISTCYSSIT